LLPAVRPLIALVEDVRSGVLALVQYLPRVISFRHASNAEREVYDDWLENECDEP